MSVCNVPLVTFLAFEEYLTFLAAEQANIVHLCISTSNNNIPPRYLQFYLVLVAIPMCPRLCDLATEFAGARPVVVDHVVEGHVVAGQLLLLRDDQRPVYVWQEVGLSVKLVMRGEAFMKTINVCT